MRDLHNNIALRQTLNPAARTSTISAAAADRRGHESVEHVALIGQSGDALSGSVKFTIKIEESGDGGSFTPITDNAKVLGGSVDASGIFATIDSTSEDEMAYRIGYVGNERYSRLTFTFTGTHTNGTPLAALAILSHAQVKPTA